MRGGGPGGQGCEGAAVVPPREEGGHGHVLHTPPEWYKRGSYRAGPLTVWQVGVLLYDMLVGHCPFQTRTEIIQERASTHPEGIIIK
ncbi:hypothetical protein CRUP_011515 [Coryphaenoides rupestris]|nr:hypothetical protein CRUP_011515 [Coryphaenoides rupestris]